MTRWVDHEDLHASETIDPTERFRSFYSQQQQQEQQQQQQQQQKQQQHITGHAGWPPERGDARRWGLGLAPCDRVLACVGVAIFLIPAILRSPYTYVRTRSQKVEHVLSLWG